MEEDSIKVCGNGKLYTHTLYFISCTSFCHLHPQIAKARRSGRRGKVTEGLCNQLQESSFGSTSISLQNSHDTLNFSYLSFSWYTLILCRLCMAHPRTRVLTIGRDSSLKSKHIVCHLLARLECKGR